MRIIPQNDLGLQLTSELGEEEEERDDDGGNQPLLSAKLESHHAFCFKRGYQGRRFSIGYHAHRGSGLHKAWEEFDEGKEEMSPKVGFDVGQRCRSENQTTSVCC